MLVSNRGFESGFADPKSESKRWKNKRKTQTRNWKVENTEKKSKKIIMMIMIIIKKYTQNEK